MASLTMKNPAGKDAGTVELDESMFGVQPNVPLMHQVVTAQLAARRSGTQSTKTRSDVRGGGAKPYRQKGTGNARQGSIRSPQFTGGGVAHGPKPRKYDQKTPKKMIKAALRSALSDRAHDDKIIVVESWGIDSPKTKDAKRALGTLGIEGTALIVLGPDDAAAALSFRNLPAVQVIDVSELNAYDVLCNDWIVFTKATLPSGQAASSAASGAPAAPADPADTGDSSSSSSSSDVVAGEYPGSAQPLEDAGEAPAGHEIKGNADSMRYHVPGSRYYKTTKAEVWFDTAESAEAAGFTAPGTPADSADTAGDTATDKDES